MACAAVLQGCARCAYCVLQRLQRRRALGLVLQTLQMQCVARVFAIAGRCAASFFCREAAHVASRHRRMREKRRMRRLAVS